jgi:hypothetical protein
MKTFGVDAGEQHTTSEEAVQVIVVADIISDVIFDRIAPPSATTTSPIPRLVHLLTPQATLFEIYYHQTQHFVALGE